MGLGLGGREADRVGHRPPDPGEALGELVQAAGLPHPNDTTPPHIGRRLADTEVRLLANLPPQVAPGALLDRDISSLHNVYKLYWPKARADSFKLAM